MDLKSIKQYHVLFEKYNTCILLRNDIIHFIVKHEEDLEYFLIFFQNINDILQQYINFGIEFLLTTLNFNRNEHNILEHTIRYIQKLLYENNIYDFKIEYMIVPHEISSSKKVIRFLEQNAEYKKIPEHECYTLFCDKLTVFNELKYSNDSTNIGLYEHFTIQNLKILILNFGIVGMGYQIHNDQVKKITVLLNDDYYFTDPYETYVYYDKKYTVNSLAILGKHHPIIIEDRKYYYSNRNVLNIQEIQKNSDIVEKINDIDYIEEILRNITRQNQNKNKRHHQ